MKDFNKFYTSICKMVLAHRAKVSTKLTLLGNDLVIRGRRHDNSKTEETELTIISKYMETKIEDDKVLAESIHNSNNDHHLEFFNNDISKMNILQLTEWVCDQMSILEDEYEKSDIHYTDISIDTYKDRISSLLEDKASTDLLEIVLNTVEYIIDRRDRLSGRL